MYMTNRKGKTSKVNKMTQTSPYLANLILGIGLGDLSRGKYNFGCDKEIDNKYML